VPNSRRFCENKDEKGVSKQAIAKGSRWHYITLQFQVGTKRRPSNTQSTHKGVEIPAILLREDNFKIKFLGIE